MSYLSVADGTDIYFQDWGSGTPVVFCHGNNLNSDCWEHQLVPLLFAGYRCVAFDRRGHGRSSEPGHGYDFDTLAGDLAALLEHLDLRGVTLVGHSTGACDVARYLSKYGSERITRSILVAPATPFTARSDDNPTGFPQEVFDGWISEMLTDRPKYYTEGAKPFFGPTVSPKMVSWGIRMVLTSSLLAAVGTVQAQATTDLRPDMRAFTMPTLIVHAANDVVPAELTSLATHRAIPHSELKIYEDAYHGLPITHAAQFNRDIIEFIAAGTEAVTAAR